MALLVFFHVNFILFVSSDPLNLRLGGGGDWDTGDGDDAGGELRLLLVVRLDEPLLLGGNVEPGVVTSKQLLIYD